MCGWYKYVYDNELSEKCLVTVSKVTQEMLAAGPILPMCKRKPRQTPRMPSRPHTYASTLIVVSLGFRFDWRRVRANMSGYTIRLPMHDENEPKISFSPTFGSLLFIILLYLNGGGGNKRVRTIYICLIVIIQLLNERIFQKISKLLIPF